MAIERAAPDTNATDEKVKIWEQRLFLENIFFEALFEKISHILLQFVNEHHHCFNQAPNVD